MTTRHTTWKLVLWLLLAPVIALAGKGGGMFPAAAPDAEGAGNNLSFPVIWSDGVSKALRGEFGAPVFAGEFYDDEGVLWYLQQDELNAWQAENLDAVDAGMHIAVDEIDWGDNLEARDWTTNSVVRTETVLYQDVSAMPMLGFTMQHLWGEGVDEMWGTNTETYLGPEATVYSHCARLTIQKLIGSREDPLGLSWNALTGQWEGDIEEPDFTGGVWEAGDGPGYYSAEINIPGKVIYGYNWRVRKLHPEDTAGDYRVTFSFSPDCGVLNTSFDEESVIRMPEEEVMAEAEDSEPGDPGGGVAVVEPGLNLTYIDVRIVEATGNGGGGGGHQGDGGGGGRGQGGPAR